ncbi:MAG: lysophospholipid acyltransferase family protein [Spirochaetaceae bacterium]|jgi:1-acyl-sn-glycerol-3-phosphate acyltransferase|nr:lysophospholipid acyltransferase family protein [Spirochaetaceae bacterium]
MSQNKFVYLWRVFNQTLWFIPMRTILNPILRLLFNVHYQVDKDVRRVIRKGCIVLPVHTISYDPILIACGLRRPVHWVATEAIFRKKLLGAFMRDCCGSIPKTKNRSDMEMLKMLQAYASMNRPVGIYPEGQQTWDGKGLSPMAGTDKLIRFLKLPVVFVNTEGGYLTLPRWTKKARKNRILYRARVGITAEEVKTIKVTEIRRRLDEFLDYNDYEMQKQRKIPLKSKKRAEHLELTLFTCPSCKKLGSLISKGNNLSCSHCNYSADVDKYGFFMNKNQSPYFPTPVEWNSWQQESLVEYLKDKPPEDLLIEDGQVDLYTSRKRRPLVKVDSGKTLLYSDRLEFHPDKGEPRVFNMRQITGFNVFKQQSTEFYYEQILYRLQFTLPQSSGYKWLSMVDVLNTMADALDQGA